jgi:hypothetical protein
MSWLRIIHQTTPFPQRTVRRVTPSGFPVQFSEMESAVASAYLASSYPTDIATVKEWINQGFRPMLTRWRSLSLLAPQESAWENPGLIFIRRTPPISPGS